MTNKKDINGELLPEEHRLTQFGRKLRSSSLDELPELFNILKGDMSLVGPRPLLVKYIPYYSDYESIRHSVKPGLTGYAQVNGRNQLSWNERLSLDVWYVEHQSFSLDISIILKTFINVINKKGVIENPTLEMKDLRTERRQLLREFGFIINKEQNLIAKIFCRKTINLGPLHEFIRLSNQVVTIPISDRVDIDEYVSKIYNLATLITVWQGNKLVGLNAIYMYDPQIRSAFITLNVVLPEFQGQKIGKKLLQLGFDEAKENNKVTMILEVNQNAENALKMYYKYGFVKEKMSKDGAFYMSKNLK